MAALLHEFLKQDQEPFQLKQYINDRRYQLKRTTSTNNNDNPSKTTSLALQPKRRQRITDAASANTSTAIAKGTICKHACFPFSFQDSPNVRKPPFLDSHSQAKSPCARTPDGKVFLHVPARTASLLLEASMRIQKQQSSSSSSSFSHNWKPKSQIKNMGLGLFSSLLKKLKDRSKNKRCEIRETRFESPRISAQKTEEKVANAVGSSEGCSCSCNHSRLSSAGWSESNEEKSLDMETSTSMSCRSRDSDGMSFVVDQDTLLKCASCESLFCTSPLSPFRFSLQRSPSFGCGHQTPDFSSPAESPRRHKDKKSKNYEENGFEETKQVVAAEEEKEQCSPVSVLDPPFEDEEEDDGHAEGGADEDYDLECSFAIVQKAKEQLLYKLRRFEKLAALDPIELEKRMMEQLDEDDESECQDVVEEGCVDNEFLPSNKGCSLDSFVNEVCIKSSTQNRRKAPTDFKRLVSDLISEEKKREFKYSDKEIVVGKVCKKLDSWKGVESNTIDMMVELDFRSESDEWKSFQEQKEETAIEIELAIFGVLLHELSQELTIIVSSW